MLLNFLEAGNWLDKDNAVQVGAFAAIACSLMQVGLDRLKAAWNEHYVASKRGRPGIAVGGQASAWCNGLTQRCRCHCLQALTAWLAGIRRTWLRSPLCPTTPASEIDIIRTHRSSMRVRLVHAPTSIHIAHPLTQLWCALCSCCAGLGQCCECLGRDSAWRLQSLHECICGMALLLMCHLLTVCACFVRATQVKRAASLPALLISVAGQLTHDSCSEDCLSCRSRFCATRVFILLQLYCDSDLTFCERAMCSDLEALSQTHRQYTESVPKVEVHLLTFGTVTWRKHLLTKFSFKEGLP